MTTASASCTVSLTVPCPGPTGGVATVVAVRIVSLLPSATEILFAIGAGDQVVGVSVECDHPPAARTRLIVSSTTLPRGLSPAEIDVEVRARMAAGEDLYTLDAGALRDLTPDVIVSQDLCAVCAVDVADVDAALEHLGCQATVVTLDPMTLPDVYDTIIELGAVTNRAEQARRLVADLRARAAAVATAVRGRPRPRLAVLEWTDPPYSAGHWIPDMIEAAGATSALGTSGARSRRITWDALAEAEPDGIVVAPCGYRLAQATTLAHQLVADDRLPSGVPVWAADADAAFVRPAPRLLDGIEALAAIAHPGTLPHRGDVVTPLATQALDA